MKSIIRASLPLVLLALVVGSCGDAKQEGYQDQETPAGSSSLGMWVEDPDPSHPALLDSGKAREKAPESYRARFVVGAIDEAGEAVDVGSFIVEVKREWAPQAADRFYNLVKIGYLDQCRFFRTVPGFVSQFGMHGDPKIYGAWKGSMIGQDPMVPGRGNEAGTLAFACMMSPGTANVQIFINLVDNRQKLDRYRLFPPFAKVIEGMDVVSKLYTGYGERPNQQLIESQGNVYLAKTFPKLNYIKSARLAKQ